MKKFLCVLLSVFLIFCAAATAFTAAQRSSQTLIVNGTPVSCTPYNIDGNNYFKLRDLAFLLRDTARRFSVGYDGAQNRVTLTRGDAYIPVGGELAPSEDLSATAKKSVQTLSLDGAALSGIAAYNIGGNNYFKLRDLGDALGFFVGYDEAQNAVLLTTPDDGDPSLCTVTFIDCGQGDAALITCGGESLLIDGGPIANSQKLYTVLKERRIGHLSAIVATHPHEDHIGGIPGALSYADAARTYSVTDDYPGKAFSDFKRYAEEKGGGLSVPAPGERFNVGSAEVRILAVNTGTENDSSVVLSLTHGENTFLFTGDGEALTEEALIASDAPLSADVLKVSHHGSSDATGDAFLSRVAPRYAVISVGKDNDYAHPSDVTLRRLSDAGAEVFRTDRYGSVTFTSDGKTLLVSTEKRPAPTAEKSAALPVSDETEKSGAAYVVNINTGVFHIPTCKSVSQMKEKNKRFSDRSRDELIAEGYSPCRNCQP